jgi:hypothetical protein
VEVIEIEAELFRLIPSRFPPVHVFEGLVANDRLDEVAAAETRTNPRIIAEERLKAKGGGSSHRFQNFNHAPFKYTNPDGSVFFPPIRPALELADCRQTALAIAVARRERFLKRTAEPPTGLDMRLLKTPIKGRFADFCHIDPDAARDERLKAAALIPTDVDGIIFRPAERKSHRCFAVLNGQILGHTLQTSHFRFWWDANRIRTVYAFENATQWDAAILSNPADLLAA